MVSKYNMSLEDNLFFAKRKLIDNIYKSANLEGIAITFADTVDFVNNINNGKLSVDEMIKLRGLKDAWEFVLNNISDELTTNYIKKIHFEICKGSNVYPLGEYRDKGVGITGTEWRPKLPSECNYDEEIEEIMKIDNKLDRCITLFCFLQRSQMFIDGNKRVDNLIANKEMIKNGQGIINVPVDKIGEYFNVLINFYETNDYTKIKEWVYINCIDGI
jgi:hypothetical protein